MKQKNMKIRVAVTFVLVAALIIIIVASASAMVHNAAPAPLSTSVQKKDVWVTKMKTPYQADNFSLVDQHGKPVSLDRLHGKTVVLTFMDPNCTDICLLVSHEFIMAARRLGIQDNGVVFLAVNINQYHHSQSDVLKFSQAHGLNNLPNWHFLTGNPAVLKAVWQAYGISVIPSKDGDVSHTSIIYFIDPEGQVQYLANPNDSKNSVKDWSQAIAHYTRLTSES